MKLGADWWSVCASCLQYRAHSAKREGSGAAAHHEETKEIHVCIAGAAASEVEVVLQGLPERLQLLPERLDAIFALTELHRTGGVSSPCP